MWSPVGWSPDGRHMAFVRLTTEGSSVIVADAEGTHERVVSSRRPLGRFYAVVSSVDRNGPAWSPDGRRLAVRGSHTGAQEAPVGQVVMIDVATDSTNAIPLPRPGSGAVEWLDDASLVATIDGQLWRVSLPGGQLSRITNDLLKYRHLSLTAERSTLVTARVDRRAAVWVGDSAGSKGADVVELGPGIGDEVAWAGERLLYTNRGGIWVVTPGAGPGVELVARASAPAASGDGRVILFQRDEAGDQGGTWKANAEGRDAVRISADRRHR